MASEAEPAAPSPADGFTLIELMIVVLIMAVLMAVAIPTFLGAKATSHNRRAQADLRNALTFARSLSVDFDGRFVTSANPDVPILEADLAAVDSGFTFADGAPAVAGPIDIVNTSDGSMLVLYNRSASGEFFCLRSSAAGIVSYGRGTSAAAVDGSAVAECASDRF